jgi:hypothetical protein
MENTRLIIEDIPPILCPDLENIVLLYVNENALLPFLKDIKKRVFKCRLCNIELGTFISRYKLYWFEWGHKCDKMENDIALFIKLPQSSE